MALAEDALEAQAEAVTVEADRGLLVADTAVLPRQKMEEDATEAAPGIEDVTAVTQETEDVTGATRETENVNMTIPEIIAADEMIPVIVDVTTLVIAAPPWMDDGIAATRVKIGDKRTAQTMIVAAAALLPMMISMLISHQAQKMRKVHRLPWI